MFLSQAAKDEGVPEALGLSKMAIAVGDTRRLAKKDMMLNGETPKVEVDPDTFEVRVDGEVATAPAVKELPLTQRYFLF